MTEIVIVEDDVTFAALLKRFLERNQFTVQLASNLSDAKSTITQNTKLVFTDVRLPDGDGITFLSDLKTKFPNLPIIVMTSYAEVSSAVKAMKQGAFDYISKPFNQDEVLNVIGNALKEEHTTVKTTTETATEHSKTTQNTGDFINGISKASQQLEEYIQLVAPTNMSVLIIGDSGTGKEVAAKSIHLNSNRSAHNFIAVDCGAIPKEIAASEFFGHVKGSFTGAVTDKKGHFETANGGTIFLDEVGNLSYENQVQLLRALQERKIKPVGSSKEIDVDIRVLAATNENLQEAVENGDFREDLFHRLNEFSIKMPTLAERIDDLTIFIDYFLEKANEQLNKSCIGFTKDAMKILQAYHWPGNLRELQNIIKRSVLLSQDELIDERVLPYELKAEPSKPAVESFSTKDHEKELIINALEKANHNKTVAAKLLNITRKTLYNKLKAYGIDA